MKALNPWGVILIVTIAMGLPAVAAAAEEKAAEEPSQTISIPGRFIRIAVTQDGWVTLGYKTANNSVGEEWMLLDVLLALPYGVSETRIERSDIAVVAPGSQVVQLATQMEYQEAGYLRALNRRADVARDSVNYAPSSTTRARPLNFFGETGARGALALGKDVISISDRFGAVGRLFFRIPGGIQYGVHNLVVSFSNTTVKVPFEIMSEERLKTFEKTMKEIEERREELEEVEE